MRTEMQGLTWHLASSHGTRIPMRTTWVLLMAAHLSPERVGSTESWY